MVSNQKVVAAWRKGLIAKARNMSTDGVNLYSYNLVIGKRSSNGTHVLDYTSSGEYGFRSITTSKHVGMAFRT